MRYILSRSVGTYNELRNGERVNGMCMARRAINCVTSLLAICGNDDVSGYW